MRRFVCRINEVVNPELGWWFTPAWAWHWYSRGGWLALKTAWHHASGGNTCR